MDPNEQLEKPLKNFIVHDLIGGSSPVVIQTDQDLLLSGLVDSLGIVRLINFIEKEMKISIPPEDVTLENFQTVGCMAAYISRRSSS